jgi:hypothetical protein
MTTCKACGGEGHLPNKVLQIFLGPCYFFYSDWLLLEGDFPLRYLLS